ncbi:cytochrome P450 2C21-like [Discoglossus pictus]
MTQRRTEERQKRQAVCKLDNENGFEVKDDEGNTETIADLLGGEDNEEIGNDDRLERTRGDKNTKEGGGDVRKVTTEGQVINQKKQQSLIPGILYEVEKKVQETPEPEQEPGFSSLRLRDYYTRIMDILQFLIPSVCFFLLLQLFISIWRQKKMSRFLPPGPVPLPLLGNLKYANKETSMKYYPELCKKYGPVFTIWKTTTPIVVLCGYEVVKDALVNHAEQFSGRPALPVVDMYSKGYSFASENGQLWRDLRRGTLTSLRDLGMGKKSMEDLVLKEAKQLLAAVSETGGKVFNPLNFVGCAICNVRCILLFGKCFEYHDQELLGLLLNIRKHLRNFNSSFHQLCNTFPILLYIPAIRRKVFKQSVYLYHYVQNQIDLHKQTLDESSPRDFIDSFLLKIKQGGHMSDSYLCHSGLLMIIITILAAGTDSTVSTMKYCLVIMAHFPDIQAHVQEEIDKVTGSMRPPEIMDRPQMPYTNAVIHEIQRITDLASVGLGHAVTEDTNFRGFTIPKGTTVLPFFSSVLSDPTQWETPDEFNPGHFLDEDGQFRARSAFIAFSAGKRVCLGENLARMDLFLFFSSLLQKFTFKRAPGTQPQTGKALRDNKWTHILFLELCAVPRTSSK